jgi:hypothetical protein
MARRKYLVIDGCPVPRDVAPYIYLVLRQAGQAASSVYRGEDTEAKAILHRHGKHTQAEIHQMYPDISNPPGRSMHDLHSDGAAKAGPVGRRLEPWEVGVDSGSNSSADKRRINAAARHYGLSVYHPYSRGVEGHHWGFKRKPRADGKHLTRTRVIITRARLALNR